MQAETPEETVDELRQRLNKMKQMMAERQAAAGGRLGDYDDLGGHNPIDALQGRTRPNRAASIIDGSFLSAVFGMALLVIITVSIYAFYNLYHAILKKFPSKHTEL